jgi:hypothetical protein
MYINVIHQKKIQQKIPPTILVLKYIIIPLPFQPFNNNNNNNNNNLKFQKLTSRPTESFKKINF